MKEISIVLLVVLAIQIARETFTPVIDPPHQAQPWDGPMFHPLNTLSI